MDLSTGGSGPLCLHVHGTWSNFYKYPFALSLADAYVESGYVYATTNNPGHDGGHAYSTEEDFDESLPVLRDWIDELAPADADIILQGHSLGALKVVRMLTSPDYTALAARVRAAVLLTPLDLVALYGGTTTADIARALARARARAATLRNGPGALVDAETFGRWPISAATFLRATVEHGPWDLLPLRLGSAGALSQIDIPLFVGLSESDFTAKPSPSSVAHLLARQLPGARISLFAAAPHNFVGYEGQLSREVADFLQQVPTRGQLTAATRT